MLGNAELVARLVLAAAMGGLIGFERERLLWAAGLRTHMLVSVGACLFMLVSAFGFGDVLGRAGVVLDPSRVAAQVVSGIGFLGAGTILLRGEIVKGLTTAASLWAVAAVGLAVGGGLYVGAVAATLIILLILAGLKPVQERWHDRVQTRELRLIVKRGAITLDTLQEVAGLRPTSVRQFVARPAENEGEEAVTITVMRLSQDRMDSITRKLRDMPAVVSVTSSSA